MPHVYIVLTKFVSLIYITNTKQIPEKWSIDKCEYNTGITYAQRNKNWYDTFFLIEIWQN